MKLPKATRIIENVQSWKFQALKRGSQLLEHVLGFLFPVICSSGLAKKCHSLML